MSAKSAILNSVARLLFQIGLTDPARRSRGRLSIATFHRILPDAERQAYPYPELVVTPQELDAFLSYFTDHFECGSLSEQHERFASGEISRRPMLALTFDDGQFDNYLFARPVLGKHNVRASFFVPVQAVERGELLWHDRLGFSIAALLGQNSAGRAALERILANFGLSAAGQYSLAENAVLESKRLPVDAREHLIDSLNEAAGGAHTPSLARLMTFDELAALRNEGHEIGSHSMTHCMMPECDDSALAYELGTSREVLQARLSVPVESFCYPNGDCDERTARAVRDAGYRRAVTTRWGYNERSSDSFRLSRFDMVAHRTLGSDGKFAPANLAFRMSGFHPGVRA